MQEQRRSRRLVSTKAKEFNHGAATGAVGVPATQASTVKGSPLITALFLGAAAALCLAPVVLTSAMKADAKRQPRLEL